MSGIEVVGLILGLYPVIIKALDVYTATRGDKGAHSLARNLTTEKIIFREFVHKLVASNVSEAELVRLKISAPPDHALWKDKTLQANMRARLGTDKADNVVEILGEIQDLLKALHNDLALLAPSAHGVELLRRFRAKVRQVKYNLPQSSLKERLDRLTAHNVQLGRLLTDRSLPSASDHSKRSKPAKKYLHRDSSHAVDVYNAICDGYQCDCSVAHLANFRLPGISSDTRTNSGLLSGWQFELLFAIGDSEVDEAICTSPVELEELVTSWSQISAGGEAVGSSRKISISQCNSDHDSDHHISSMDLCFFTRNLHSEEVASDTHVGFLKLREKQYQLLTTTELQGVTSHLEYLDQLLADQYFLLSRKERMSLALSLSHAILSFYSTPWIEACWTWKDFCIDRTNDGQLFATRKFYSSNSDGSVSLSRKSSTSELWAIHGEPTLTRLGFALIELALGKRLSEMRSKDQYQSSDPDTLDFLTAKSLIKSGLVMQAESQAYEDVAKACLGHQFLRNSELIGLDSSRPGFQEHVEQSIIAPLHTIVTVSWGDS